MYLIDMNPQNTILEADWVIGIKNKSRTKKFKLFSRNKIYQGIHGFYFLNGIFKIFFSTDNRIIKKVICGDLFLINVKYKHLLKN